MKEQKFRKLEFWNKAMDFIQEVYVITNKFSIDETYGLTSQLRRASTSIALNIAEGSGSGSDNAFNRFLRISLRSSYEVMYAFEIAKRLLYYNDKDTQNLLKKSDELSAMIVGLQKKLRADS